MVNFQSRYLVFEVFINPEKQSENRTVVLTQKSIQSAIKDSLRHNFGEHGLATSLANLNVKYWNPITKLCIVRCSRQDYSRIWSAITLISAIEQHPVVFNLLDLNGNINGCRKYALKYDKAKFELYKLVKKNQVPKEITFQVCNLFEKIKMLER
eukprot:TRINITY_DN31024_c0_g1_i1.p1 TRINITY_DN31024_c0_g1~~TRINITY_DN31024_c0_g1_i1.p1  ORF type:complete len:154 (-),score=21.67 TRINITY_DN31024_c0_g1_i1:67-528(-)